MKYLLLLPAIITLILVYAKVIFGFYRSYKEERDIAYTQDPITLGLAITSWIVLCVGGAMAFTKSF